MAHGYTRYSNPYTNTGGLSAYVAGKIGAAAKMARDERKSRDEEVKSLQEKGELSDEEQQRLDFLTEQQGGRKGSFFGKALVREFGGDRARRLQGTFSKNPEASKDPALTKEQRFAAVLDRAKPADDPVQPETPFQPTIPGLETAMGEQETPNVLEKAFDKIAKSYDAIADRVSSLASEEKQSVSNDNSNNKFLSNITSGLQSLKEYFKRDNDLKDNENDIESQQLELALDRQDDAEMTAKQASMEMGSDLSGQTSVAGEPGSDEGGGRAGGGMGGMLMKFGGNLLKLIGKGRGGGAKAGAIRPQARAYNAPVGPQPMNSPSPWAAAGPGEMGNAAGFVPRMPAGVTPMSKGGVIPKLAPGGIVDNPTVTNLNPGDAVVPLNRNNALSKTLNSATEGSSGKDITDPMSKVMQLPSQVGGGLMLSLLADVMKKLGGIGSMLKPVLAPLAGPLAGAFGLPPTIINAMFGGAAQAATFDPSKYFDGESESETGGKDGTTPSTTPPGMGGADLGASMREGETIQAQDPNGPGGFIQGGSGKGSEGGQNTTGGYATHYHLTPPSNDANGWAQSRSVAFTSAKMMLARGSKIHFGNVKRDAHPGISDAELQSLIAAEQQAHTKPGRTQGGIDMQESQNGNMRLKFPLKVTNVTNDISGGSGRTARIIGTNVRLAHGAAGSANSVESAAMPQVANQPPVALPGADPNRLGAANPLLTPAPPAAPVPQVSGALGAIIRQNQAAAQRQRSDLSSTLQYSVYNPSGINSLYQFSY